MKKIAFGILPFIFLIFGLQQPVYGQISDYPNNHEV